MTNIVAPKTYLAHPDHNAFRTLLERLLENPNNSEISKEVTSFFKSHTFPAADFPVVDTSYGRTILYRAVNKYECLAAHWSKGAVSKIHGHPEFSFVIVLSGKVMVENFKKEGSATISKIGTKFFRAGQHFSLTGRANSFDNGIHRITADDESLSIHIYSDNGLLGEIFTDTP